MIQDSGANTIDWQVVKAALAARMAQKGESEIATALEAVHARIGVDELGTQYARNSTYDSASSSSQPIVRRIAGRVFPSLATRNDLGRGGFSQGTVRRWVGYIGVPTGLCLLGLYFQSGLSIFHQPSSNGQQFKEYTTTPGQRASIMLKDGTRVMLNVDSRIRVADNYSTGATGLRVIDLIGEAQFQVTHDAKRPFTVRANGSVIRDLATTFAIRAYPGTSVTRVAVREGRVSVQPPVIMSSNALSVAAGNEVTINSESKAVVGEMVNEDRYFGWTRGRLVLSEVALPEALSELGRWYGADFRVADSTMLSIYISGSFPQSLTSEGLEAIADIINAKVQRSGTTVVLYPKNHATP